MTVTSRGAHPLTALGTWLLACTSTATLPPPSPPPTDNPCDSAGTPKPHVSVGPDVAVEAMCGTIVPVPYASVANVGGGSLFWSTAIEGDSAFVLESVPADVCNGSTQILGAQFVPPQSAVPGDTFDAVVTVTFANGVFPTSQVKLHGVVAKPRVTVTPPRLDFGAVDLSVPQVDLGIAFLNDGNGAIRVTAEDASEPFLIRLPPDNFETGKTLMASVSLTPAVVGDFTTTTTWTVAPATNGTPPPAACNAQIDVEVHATVVAGDGGAD